MSGTGSGLGAGAGEALLKLFKDNFVRGLERSMPIPESGREGGGGAGDVGLLEGRKDRGFLRECIMSREYPKKESDVFVFSFEECSSICLRIKYWVDVSMRNLWQPTTRIQDSRVQLSHEMKKAIDLDRFEGKHRS